MSSSPMDPSALTCEQLLDRLGNLVSANTEELRCLLQACAEALRSEMDQSARLLDAVDTIIVGLDMKGHPLERG